MTTLSKHTPSPLHATGCRIYDSLGSLVGYTTAAWVTSDEERLANARLWAAAPELLEAAERAILVYDAGCDLESVVDTFRSLVQAVEEGGAS